MATKKRRFDSDFYYHIYNCGVERRLVFLNKRDYERFLDVISYYVYERKISYAEFQKLTLPMRTEERTNPTGSKRVQIAAYCLMPNHFHFLVKQTRSGGIVQFVSDISNSHAKYFNLKRKRIGSLFQGAFKHKEITNVPSFLQVSRYIHLNPLTSSKMKLKGRLEKPEGYPYSSYLEWISPRSPSITDREEVESWVNHAGGVGGYRSFVESKIKKNPALGIEDLILE